MHAEVVARIDALEFVAKQVVDGVLAGRHPSPRSGFSVEFAHHREYAPGDDIRHLDWKVFGRTERYQLKQYEQETNLALWLVVDASESMRYGSTPRTKFDCAAELAYGLAYLVSRQSDAVGFARIVGDVELLLKPSTAPSQTRRILTELADGPRREPGAYCRTVDQVAGRLGSRGIVVLLSDFLDDPAELAKAMRHLRHGRNEVILIHVVDPAELEFPFRHPTEFRGLEATGKLATDPNRIRDDYLENLNRHLTDLDQIARDHESDHLRIRTDEPAGECLANYLRQRAARGR
jgi:uncharacterized protein (DUF58 family)